MQTIIPELYFIQEDLEEDYDIFAGHFDLNKFKENTHITQTPKVNKKNCIIETEMHPLVIKSIEQYCEKIHWTPEGFIVNIIEYKIKYIFDDIKNKNYQFLGNYFDFEEVQESIEEIYRNRKKRDN